MTDFSSISFYDLFHENGHVPKIRRNLPPLLAGVRRSIPHWRDIVTQHIGELGEAWDDPLAWQGSANVPGLDL